MIDFKTSLGRAIDITIIFLNLLLVAIFVIDTYRISDSLRDLLWKLEILIVGIFILEYFLRLYGAPNRLSYVKDIYSIIDLVAIMPTLILLALPPSYFIYDIRVIQTIRVLAVFRIFRFLRFIAQNHLFFGLISQGMMNVARLVVSIIIIFFVYSGLFYFVESPVNPRCSEFWRRVLLHSSRHIHRRLRRYCTCIWSRQVCYRGYDNLWHHPHSLSGSQDLSGLAYDRARKKGADLPRLRAGQA